MLSDWVRLGSRMVRLLRDHHHPVKHEEVLQRLLERAHASALLREERRTRVPNVSYPANLPISARKDEILTAIRTHQVVVIAGETGSGKTTQIPKMCLEAGLGIEAKIGCTQPRRVAALSISRRLAEELNVPWGKEVGCKIRFDDRSSPETYIKLMTDGILLAETQGDPMLTEYNAIIIDEAHERSLNIDFLLGYLKGLVQKRADLKLIITSATIDTASFSKAFNDAPIIEVSGRVYPVEVVYAPFGSEETESDTTYVEAAVAATEKVARESSRGDVLIFLPSERDIRETTDLLKGRLGEAADIIPLFGRLGAGDQERVFAASSRRKVVVATNIAETSLTIPGIRYVIDSGLARISRYNPRTRTKRLPIEPVSQSSANQRKGRSGRVEDGICIRLYSEADFTERPPYTQPEIQRANLAEVILRMKAFRLGEIETFPFLNPPSPGAIQGGYTLLQELGALDEDLGLTPLGMDLARLPIDPSLGRMLLQSQHEHATRELLIVASGLSIQDPRERPLDQKEAAATAHKRFSHPESDFLTLLEIWRTVHDQWEKTPSQSQRRKFCKANFLSYLRMREWQDLHAQLHSALEELGRFRLNESNAEYAAIHRSILAGLLGHVATRTDRNSYKAVGNRQVAVFPGSVLHEKADKPRKPAERNQKPTPKKPSPTQPEWIVAGEIVETSQLFARTLAGIDPKWIVDLAPHLCRVSHLNPHWSPEAGQVLVDEKLTLYGLVVHQRKVAFGNINPTEATRIFIRSALVEENLFALAPQERREVDPGRLSASQLLAEANSQATPSVARYSFLEHNGKVRHKVETWQTRTRRRDLPDLDEALARFYERHIQAVSSIHELNRLLRGHPEAGFLCVSETDLTGGIQLDYDAAAFPDAVPLAGEQVPLSYAYSPGEECDGVTLRLRVEVARALSQSAVEWSVPGLREAQITELLRSLPKSIRRQLMPINEKVPEILRDLRPDGKSLKQDLAAFLRRRYGLEVTPDSWQEEAVPAHLRPRVELVGEKLQTLAASRDLERLRQQLEQPKTSGPAGDPPAWKRAVQKWEREGFGAWNFGDLPEKVLIEESAAGPLYGWPGLELEDDQVNIRLFRTPDQSRRSSTTAVRFLLERGLDRDLAWLQKDLRALVGLEPLHRNLCTSQELQIAAFQNAKSYLFSDLPLSGLSESAFKAALESARSRLPGLAAKLVEQATVILQLRADFIRRYCQPPLQQKREMKTLANLSLVPANPVPGGSKGLDWGSELLELVPPNFLAKTSFERLAHLPRYLKALLTRADRARLNPLKDQERARQLGPYRAALRQLQADGQNAEAKREKIDQFRWMLEEYKVSLFAQEIGTAFPVSPKRLDEQLALIRSA
jgi:ATP-dependent helicase HrpA